MPEAQFKYTQLAIKVLKKAANDKHIENSSKPEQELIEKHLTNFAEKYEIDENQLRAAILQTYTGDLSIYTPDEEIKIEELKERLEDIIEEEESS